MELPVSGPDTFLEWQKRLKRFESSGLSVDAFCRQEEFSQWLLAVRGNPLREVEAEEKAGSSEGSSFVPLKVKAQFVEILLPGGGWFGCRPASTEHC